MAANTCDVAGRSPGRPPAPTGGFRPCVPSVMGIRDPHGGVSASVDELKCAEIHLCYETVGFKDGWREWCPYLMWEWWPNTVAKLAMVGNPEASFSTIVSFIITYNLPHVDGTQNGIANNCASKHSKLHSQDAPLIFSHYALWVRFSYILTVW